MTLSEERAAAIQRVDANLRAMPAMVDAIDADFTTWVLYVDAAGDKNRRIESGTRKSLKARIATMRQVLDEAESLLNATT